MRCAGVVVGSCRTPRSRVSTRRSVPCWTRCSRLPAAPGAVPPACGDRPPAALEHVPGCPFSYVRHARCHGPPHPRSRCFWAFCTFRRAFAVCRVPSGRVLPRCGHSRRCGFCPPRASRVVLPHLPDLTHLVCPAPRPTRHDDSCARCAFPRRRCAGRSHAVPTRLPPAVLQLIGDAFYSAYLPPPRFAAPPRTHLPCAVTAGRAFGASVPRSDHGRSRIYLFTASHRVAHLQV